MSTTSAPLLLTPSQLSELVKSGKQVSILDASWFMPNSPRNAASEFLSKRIPGAQFLDLDKVASSHPLGLNHMMPEERVFADACESFGISPSSHVAIYDSHGVFSSPRALFMFRSFGHTNSSVVDGGLPLWEKEGLPVDTSETAPARKAQYPTPVYNSAAVRNYDQMVSNSSLNPSDSIEAELVLDARSAGRFSGRDPEPRPGLSSGHMPNSLSLPFNLFLESQTAGGSTFTTFRSPTEIQQALITAVGQATADRILTGKASVVASCGSGMTAGVLWLGLQLLRAPNVAIYDESWTGYAMRPESKIDKNAV